MKIRSNGPCALCLVLLAAFSSFAGMNNVVITFSTKGPDRYADGSVVRDGEHYALVWTPSGAAFGGIGADGEAVAPSKIALSAPVATKGRCPQVKFELDETFVAKNYPGGTWGVYLLDTRRYATDANGVVLKDADGKDVVAGVGGKAVNGYGAVRTTGSSQFVSASAAGTVRSEKPGEIPEEGRNLRIRDIRLVGDNVHLYVSGTMSCLRYGVRTGATPDALAAPADGDTQYGNDGDDMIIVTPKKDGARFFGVGSK